MKKEYLVLLISMLIAFAVIRPTYALSADQEVSALVVPGKLFILSPNESQVFMHKMVPIIIGTQNNASELYYSKDNSKYYLLCENCEYYNSRKPFSEGNNTAYVKALFPTGEVNEFVNFYVDTKKPKIIRNEPHNKFGNGSFEVWVKEANLKDLTLHYSNSPTKSIEFNLSDCIDETYLFIGKFTKCYINENLSVYNDQMIKFWTEVEDIAGRRVVSKSRTFTVDSIKPIINDYNLEVQGKNVVFFFNITEDNFDEIRYLDHDNGNMKWKKLCTRLKKGVCKVKERFHKGEHNLTITVYDKAMNTESINNIIINIS